MCECDEKVLIEQLTASTDIPHTHTSLCLKEETQFEINSTTEQNYVCVGTVKSCTFGSPRYY